MERFKFRKEENENFLELLEKIEAAKTGARPLEEADEADLQEMELLSDFINGEIGLKEYHRRTLNEGILAPGEIELPSLEEMHKALSKILGDEELATELVEHEKAHFEEAIKLGFAGTKLIIRFFKADDGLSLRPAFKILIPKEGDEEEIRKHLRIIIEAPQELSDLDALSTKKNNK